MDLPTKNWGQWGTASSRGHARPPTMSLIIDALVRDGLVKRETDNRDRHSEIITATEKEPRIMHEGRGRREKQLLELLQPLRKEEIDLLDRASEIPA